MTNVLVCVKRVPDSSGEVMLTDDGQRVDSRYVGHTASAHDEAAVELAISVAKATDGEVTALALGDENCVEQLRDALAVGCHHAVRIDAPADRFGPSDVAAAIADVVGAGEENGYGLILLGNDAADTGDFQVGVRLAYALGRPVVTGISTVEVVDGAVAARGDGPEGTEVFEVALPAVVTVMEGGVSPRYPSVPGRMKAKRAPVDVVSASREPVGRNRNRLKVPPAQPSQVEILGEGAAAAAAVADLLFELKVVSR